MVRDVRLEWARAQLVGGGVRAGSVDGVVRQVFAVQAQDVLAGELGLRVRAQGVSRGDVRRAVEGERSVVRGWFMRGTLHFVAAGDVRWLLGLYGERVVAGSAARYRALGLDEAVTRRALKVIAGAVADGPCTRAGITERLVPLGVDGGGQAPVHLIRRAALTGVICEGPRVGGEPAYVPAEEWLPRGEGPVGEAAVVELAVRYRRAYGPAAAEDFAGWAGLPLGMARKAWAGLRPVRAADTPPAPHSTAPADPGTAPTAPGAAPSAGADPDPRLLPAYDGYWLGHRDRTPALPDAAEAPRTLAPGGGQIRAAVIVDGLFAGTWSRTRQAGVRVDMLPGAVEPHGLAGEIQDVERFLA
ncbi:hypothetical protein SRB5_65550 [Streptomyces sp. RB5]|uniref:Winged helix DNA-binding domain-containing protein n=2 Tax=Streptomyces smaragdinus TaxID=2585196 RepID=A0A7K0CS84_9ACTN|nr:winged helix DNA-binding domain-containing protein [Streptomyces smaragdinus]MQY16357.1 hypothetical protein [Streptomyces smaragdinus]